MKLLAKPFVVIFIILCSSENLLAEPPFIVPGKAREINSEINNKNYENLKGELKNYHAELQATKERRMSESQGSVVQQGVYTGVAYSLISPSFDADTLRSLNQESLGLTVSSGYLYSPARGWGIGLGFGVFQNSKTDRSLPDFVALKPNVHLIYSFNNQFYVSGGIYTLKWQDEKYKNFVSYIGSDYQLGYKVNRRMNIKFGFSFVKIVGEFVDQNNATIPSLVSIRGIESQLLYLF